MSQSVANLRIFRTLKNVLHLCLRDNHFIAMPAINSILHIEVHEKKVVSFPNFKIHKKLRRGCKLK